MKSKVDERIVVTSTILFITIILEKLQLFLLSLNNANQILWFPSERIAPCVLVWITCPFSVSNAEEAGHV
jgi:hypothetical protein